MDGTRTHWENCAIWICDITTFPEYSGPPLPAASHVYITQLLFKSALHISTLSPEVIINMLLLSKETDCPEVSGTCHHIPAVSPSPRPRPGMPPPLYLLSSSRFFLPFKTSAPTAPPSSPPHAPRPWLCSCIHYSLLWFLQPWPTLVGPCLVMNVSISVPQRL